MVLPSVATSIPPKLLLSAPLTSASRLLTTSARPRPRQWIRAFLRHSAPPLLPPDSAHSSPAAPPQPSRPRRQCGRLRCPRGIAASLLAAPGRLVTHRILAVHVRNPKLTKNPIVSFLASRDRPQAENGSRRQPTPASYTRIHVSRNQELCRKLPQPEQGRFLVTLFTAIIPYFPYPTLASATTISTSTMQGPDLPDPDQHRDKRQRFDEANTIDTEDPIRLPSHEGSALRHKEDTSIPTPTPNAMDMDMDMDQQPESVRDTLDELQKDMGEPFLLCRSKLKPSRPDPSRHLLGIYGLSPLLGDVIRMDPITGEKINKLRKSYEGQIKLFGLAGKNKPDPCVRKKEPAEEAEPGPLRKAIGSSWRGLQSDQDWRAEHPSSEIATDDDLRRRMRKALAIQPGTVRNPAEWDEYLGHDKTRPGLGHPPVAVAPWKVPNGVIQQSRPRQPVDKRTTRGKKRSYDDDSFVGYGDGYSDVEDAGARDDDDDGASRKKRRKPSFGF
ncbi:hypothetical protein DV736_g2224, partial [Chaetothyriales sp. CBS 134916]